MACDAGAQQSEATLFCALCQVLIRARADCMARNGEAPQLKEE